MHARCGLLLVSVVVAALSGCSHGDAGLSPLLAQGTYTLEAVSGRGAASGSIVLSMAGEAVRRVRYAQPGVSQSMEYVARGSFRLAADGTLDLRLREDDGRSPYVWQPVASLRGGVLQLRFPDPGDGPDIVESYRRQ